MLLGKPSSVWKNYMGKWFLLIQLHLGRKKIPRYQRNLMILSTRSTKTASDHLEGRFLYTCTDNGCEIKKKKWRNSAREYTTLELLVAIFTMFLAKVLTQIKARSRLCLRNVLSFPVMSLHKI